MALVRISMTYYLFTKLCSNHFSSSIPLSPAFHERKKNLAQPTCPKQLYIFSSASSFFLLNIRKLEPVSDREILISQKRYSPHHFLSPNCKTILALLPILTDKYLPAAFGMSVVVKKPSLVRSTSRIYCRNSCRAGNERGNEGNPFSKSKIIAVQKHLRQDQKVHLS